MSQQQQTDKQPKQPVWWVPITFSIMLAWLVNNFIAIATFISTGVVKIGSHGLGYFLLVLGISALCSALSFILAIRLCVSLVLSLASAVFKSIFEGIKPQPVSQEGIGAVQLPKQETQPVPLSRAERLRNGFASAGISILAWLFVPKRFRR